MKNRFKLAIIGCGKWGINHVKTAYKLLGSDLKAVCDINSNTYVAVRSVSELIPFTTRLEQIIDDADINCAIISTPAATHYEIAKKCLLNGKHVLVEKPITLVSDEAEDLVRIARESHKILMVGHVLLYHPAIIELKKIIKQGWIGKLQYIYSNRLNLGTIRSEENILWSFAPHDISIIQFLTESYPIYVDAKGAGFIQNNIHDTTFTYLVYPHNIHAHIFVSWLHPFKEHRLIVIGDKGMLVFEDNLKVDKLRFYPNGYYNNNGSLEIFKGNFESIKYENRQPLEEEQKHLFDCILSKHKPLTDGVHAIEVLKILERAQNRLRKLCRRLPSTKKNIMLMNTL